MAEHRRDGQRHLLEQVGDVGERKRRELDRPRVQRQHDRRSIRRQDPEVATIRSIARERHDFGAFSREAALTEILVDAIAQLGALNCALIGHELSRQGRDPHTAVVPEDEHDAPVGRTCRYPYAVGDDALIEGESGPTSTSSHKIERVTRAEGATRTRRPRATWSSGSWPM